MIAAIPHSTALPTSSAGPTSLINRRSRALTVVSALLLFAIFGGTLRGIEAPVTPEVAAGASPAVHTWERIEYPSFPLPGLETEHLDVLVRSSPGDDVSSLTFTISWSGSKFAKLPEVLADETKLAARLHLPDGKVLPPNQDRRPDSWAGAGTRGMTYSLSFAFPWAANTMEEAWIELTIADHKYWVELPYGFIRNAGDTLPTDRDRGSPVFPSTMKDLGENDTIVPWEHVYYDLGEIQNGWRLSLEVSNPFGATAEVVLYRHPDESTIPWDLHTPRTSVEIRTYQGQTVRATPMGIRLHSDHLRRSDDYSFHRFPDDGRGWGTIFVKVDDKSYECLVPSSLYKYTHGLAEPGHPKRLPRRRAYP